jgi:hypothetical protein
MLETSIEHRFVFKKIRSLPRGMKVPPKWAQQAARLAWETGFGAPFKDLTPDQVKKDPRGCLKELIGIYEGLLAYVSNPGIEVPKIPGAAKAVKDVRKFAGSMVQKGYLKYLKALEEATDRILPPPTNKELIECGKRYVRGLGSFMSPDGEFQHGRTATSKIYYLIWFSWPELEMKKELRAEDLRNWLAHQYRLFASQKLVEAIYTKLKLARSKRRKST